MTLSREGEAVALRKNKKRVSGVYANAGGQGIRPRDVQSCTTAEEACCDSLTHSHTFSHSHTHTHPLLHAFFTLSAWRIEPFKLIITAINRPQHMLHTQVSSTLTRATQRQAPTEGCHSVL